MSIDDMKHEWRNIAVAADPDLAQLVSQISKAQRRRSILLGAFTFNTALALLFSGYVMTKRHNGALVPMLLLQAVLFLALAMLVRRHRRVPNTGPIAEAAVVALEVVERELKNQRLLLRFAFAALFCFGLAILSLVDSGKMRPRDAVSMAILCAIILAVNSAVAIWRRRTQLLPQQQRLRELTAGLM